MYLRNSAPAIQLISNKKLCIAKIPWNQIANVLLLWLIFANIFFKTNQYISYGRLL